MRHIDIADLTPGSVDSTLLQVVLDRYGWRRTGGRRGLYDRWINDQDPQRKLIVPLDSSRPDYRELIEDVLHVLAGSDLAAAHRVLEHLAATPGDEVRFCKDVPTVGAAVLWNVGEELHQAAGSALKASAKASVDRRPKFGNRNAFVAKDFMNAVLMGQNEISSYVVTAYIPPSQRFYDSETHSRAGLLDSGRYHSGREVVEIMRDVLVVTREALDENARTGAYEQFDEAVQYGLSKEMTSAVKGFVNNSDGAAVKIEWSRATNLADKPSMDVANEIDERTISNSEIEFKPTDYPVLKQVEERLEAPTEIDQVTVTGSVEVLTRQVGRVGVIVVNVRSGSPAKKIRVQLPYSSYNTALEAHRLEYPIRVSGRQERRGNYYWLFDPGSLVVLDYEPAQRNLLRNNADET